MTEIQQNHIDRLIQEFGQPVARRYGQLSQNCTLDWHAYGEFHRIEVGTTGHCDVYWNDSRERQWPFLDVEQAILWARDKWSGADKLRLEHQDDAKRRLSGWPCTCSHRHTESYYKCDCSTGDIDGVPCSCTEYEAAG